MSLNLRHQTPQEFIERLRDAYRASSGDRCIALGEFALAAIVRGDLTEEAVRTAFGLSPAGWVTLKTRIQQRIDARNTVRAAFGE